MRDTKSLIATRRPPSDTEKTLYFTGWHEERCWIPGRSYQQLPGCASGVLASFLAEPPPQGDGSPHVYPFVRLSDRKTKKLKPDTSANSRITNSLRSAPSLPPFVLLPSHSANFPCRLRRCIGLFPPRFRSIVFVSELSFYFFGLFRYKRCIISVV